MNPIVFRVAGPEGAPDFDAFEIDEVAGRERFVGSVMVPLDDAKDLAVLIRAEEDWLETPLPTGTPWSDATTLLYIKLQMEGIPARESFWESVDDASPIRVSIRR